MAESKSVLTVDDLIERWGITREMIFKHVDNPDNPLDAFSLADPKKKGKNRSNIRFRVESVVAFEKAMERRAIRPAETHDQIPTGMPAGFTGTIHTRGVSKPMAKKVAR